MSRVEQSQGAKGSLKWIQLAIEERWPDFEQPLLQKLSGSRAIQWRSPLRGDNFAEYRDADFLKRLGLEHLTEALSDFWPQRGPQWDALGRTDAGHVLLIEAKAHVKEFCSSGTGSGPESRAIIEARLAEVASALGAAPGRPWADMFYQLANRLAHLWFLRHHQVPAFLMFADFLGDKEMGGPDCAETWQAAHLVAEYALGLPSRHPLSPFILHVHPRVPS